MGQRCSSCGSSSIAAKTPLAAESGANVSVETVPAADDVELNDVNSDEQQAPAPASDEAAAAAEKDDAANQRKLFKTVLAPASGVEGGYSKEEAKIAKALLAKKAKGSALAEFEADEAEYAAEDAAAVRFHAKDDGIVCQRNAYHDAFSLLERI